MSSSKKKQLRKEQYMTQRQAAAAQEAKKLKRYTLAFWVVIILVASIFVGAVVSNPIKNVIYSNTKAMNVGSHTLTSVDVNYYYVDAVNKFVSENNQYLQLLIDTTKPLDEQVYNKETGATWADTFLESAKQTIKTTYALYEAAQNKGHKMTDEESKSVDTAISNASLYAAIYGYSDLTAYLRAMYGNGANEKSYRNYLEVAAMAQSYLTAYGSALEYTAQDLLNFQSANPFRYNSFTFASYTLNATEFRKGGTKDDKGNITYSDEEKAAAIKDAEAAANKLLEGTYATLEELDEAIKALEVNEGKKSAAATRHEDVLYDEISSSFQEWLIGKVENEENKDEPIYEVRKEGEMTLITNYSGSGDSKVITGYTLLRFGSVEDNNFAMKNVRHVLIKFEGGSYNSSTGETTYTDAEKSAARKAAQKLLDDWVAAGDLSEESFAELAKKNSKDGNAAEGGLYEDVFPGQMVENFENWLYDAERKVGDYGLVESPYGYHIMFFVGDSDTTFRDFMITNVKRSEDVAAWRDALIAETTLEVLTIKHVDMDLVLSH